MKVTVHTPFTFLCNISPYKIDSNYEKEKPLKAIKFESKLNPWNVSSVSKFLKVWYCCPECEFSCIDQELFCQHAIEKHEKSKILFGGALTYISGDQKIKPLEQVADIKTVPTLKNTYIPAPSIEMYDIKDDLLANNEASQEDDVKKPEHIGAIYINKIYLFIYIFISKITPIVDQILCMKNVGTQLSYGFDIKIMVESGAFFWAQTIHFLGEKY